MSPVDRRLQAAAAEPFAGRAKGLLEPDGVTLRELVAAGSSVLAPPFTTPVATLRRAAIEHNVAAMARYCAERGVALAPHAKTTMAPQLLARQLDAGAWGLTAATPWQASALSRLGAERVLLANEVVDPADVRHLAGLAHAGTEALWYVDDADVVARTDEALARDDARARVLVELGYDGGRTGCRSEGDVVAVAAAVADAERLELAGVAGYEGLLGTDRGPGALSAVRGYLDRLRGAAERLAAEGALPDEPILSAGGSAFFDEVVARLRGALPGGAEPVVVLRSGCYVTHDHGRYARLAPEEPRFEPAVEVWSQVLSRPEPRRALLNAGRRDLPFDADLPTPLRGVGVAGGALDVEGLRVAGMDDQHAYAAVPAAHPLRPGDRIALGISHPCTLFDRWRWLFAVDDDDRVVEVVTTTF